MSVWALMTIEQRLRAVSANWEEGASAGEIARRLGTTRNAVLGLVNRHRALFRRRRAGVSLREGRRVLPFARPARGRASPAPRRPRIHAENEDGPAAALPALAAPAAAGGAPAAPVRYGPVGLLEARDDQCRFPLWPDGARVAPARRAVCGARAVPGTSWCRECLGVVARGPSGEEDRRPDRDGKARGEERKARPGGKERSEERREPRPKRRSSGEEGRA